jgi:hypothetical protein
MKTNKLALLTTLLLTACSAEGSEYDGPDTGSDAGPGRETLGSMEQAIYHNGDFGVQTNGDRCSAGATHCSASKSKTRRYKFFASTCSSTFQGYFVTAMTGLESFMSTYGWTLIGDGENYDVELRCGTSIGGISIAGQPAATRKSGVPTVTTLAGGMQWAQYPKHLVTVNSSFITGMSEWASASAQRRAWLVENTIRHEWGHVFGLGHNTAANELMNAGVQPNFWTGLRGYTVGTERFWLHCYNPSVPSTSPMCP